MTRLILILAGLLVTACASSIANEVPTQTISYTRGPCFGACPIYRVTVNADGTGVFVGERFTAVQGERRFTLTPGQWQAFVARLAPYRPQGAEEINMGHARCQMAATDHPSAIVTWAGGGRSDRLGFYFGCRDEENRAMAEALEEAPGLLPIAEMIGPRR